MHLGSNPAFAFLLAGKERHRVRDLPGVQWWFHARSRLIGLARFVTLWQTGHSPAARPDCHTTSSRFRTWYLFCWIQTMEGTGDRTQVVMTASQKNIVCTQYKHTRRIICLISAQQANYIQNTSAHSRKLEKSFKFSIDHHDSDQWCCPRHRRHQQTGGLLCQIKTFKLYYTYYVTIMSYYVTIMSIKTWLYHLFQIRSIISIIYFACYYSNYCFSMLLTWTQLFQLKHINSLISFSIYYMYYVFWYISIQLYVFI